MVPIVSFVCWNRAGLTARNLNALLESTDDFELHIVDSNSQDDTWTFLQTLKDSRIKEIKRLDLNRGAPYAINYIIAQRKKDQFFMHVDSDSYMITKDWVTKFMQVMNEYPEIGAACTVNKDIYQIMLNYFTPTHFESNGIPIERSDNFFAGNCICIRPDVIDKIGYFNEETGRCDSDYGKRMAIATKYKIAFVKQIEIDQTQDIACDKCLLNGICTIKNSEMTCFKLRESKYQNMIFDNLTTNMFTQYMEDVKNGKRDAYCASIHDEESMKNHYYNKEVAEKNFKYYIDNAN